MYQCLASEWDNKVEKKIQSVVRQVKKYGFSTDYKVVSTEVKEVPFYHVEGCTKVKLGTVPVKVVNYEFNMPDFKVGDYTPVAVIEHNVVVNCDDVKNMVHLINNFENAPKSWWTIDGHCDDCNDSYSRKKTVMLLNNTDGTFRQIGTSCLKRYLGVTCFNVIHNFMTVDELVEEEVAMYGDALPRENKYVKTEKLLGYVYSMYDAMGGYIKNKTIEDAWKAATNPDADEVSESCKERAQKTIEFFRNLDIENLNDFARNVKAAVLSEYIDCSSYVACAPMLQTKLMAKIEQHNLELESDYVGNIKDKLELDVTVTNCAGFESQFGYMFINTFRDNNSNNVFIWVTGTKSYEVGSKLKILGTVKDHKEYNGVKQTVLTRVKEIA